MKFRAVITERNATIHFTLQDLADPNPSFSIRELLLPWLRAGNEPDEFTGVKDRNGKEVYTGDILKGTSYLYGYQLEGGEQFDYFGVVEWQSQADVGLCFILMAPDGGAWNLNQCVHRNDIDHVTGEILGNVHQHPQLLPDRAAV